MSDRGPSLPPNLVTRQPEPPRGKAPNSGNTPPRTEQPNILGWKLYDPEGWRQPRRGGTGRSCP